ncbi:hypothetical protein AM571_PA00112 (plasmid) [Rhizobium etli 8C-3]|uniref:Uncharacterized protein n=2 Tax=Rhizobium etli TaxID=29449 RepID=A0A1L5P9Y7_RHIET|nr:hypothetical protein AM571_PA00112 [Rhizobium etli 8C-3]
MECGNDDPSDAKHPLHRHPDIKAMANFNRFRSQMVYYSFLCPEDEKVTLISEKLGRFLQEDDSRPVVILHPLLVVPEEGLTRCSEFLPMAVSLMARHGAEIMYLSDHLPALVAEGGLPWDAVALVRYPTRQAFAKMIEDPEYYF